MESDSFRGVAETAEVSRIVIVRIATMQRLLGRARREAGAWESFDARGRCISESHHSATRRGTTSREQTLASSSIDSAPRNPRTHRLTC